MKDGTEDLELEELAEEPAVEEVEGETPEAELDDGEDAEEELAVWIEGEEPPKPKEHVPAPQWVKNLRIENKELARELRELKAQRAAMQAEPAQVAELPPRPKIEDEQFDVEKYTQKLEVWLEQKRAHDERVKSLQAKKEAFDREWQEDLQKFSRAKDALRVQDYDEAIDRLKSVLDVTQLGVLVQATNRPDLVVYALGKSAKKAKELAAITNPVKFTAAVVRMEERELKTSQPPAKPAPERRVSGTSPIGSGLTGNLEALRKKAEETGDYTAYFDAKRKVSQSK